MRKIFSSLAVINYRKWFIGALISNIGFWMQRTAQDWIVLTELTDFDAAAVGITTALQMLPMVLISPAAGVLSDRFDRRRILICTNTAMALVAVVLATLIVIGQIELWHIYAAAGASGLIAAVENPTKQAFVSELVARDRLTNAVSLNSASFHLARTAGPPLAAAMVLVTGAGIVFYVNAISFLALIALIMALDPGKLEPAPRLATVRGNITGGIRYVLTQPHLKVLFVAAFIFGTFVMNFPIYTSTMTTIAFGLGVAEYGVLLSFLASGSVLGALMAARREKPRLVIIAVSAATLTVVMSISAFAPSFWLLAVGMVFAGLSAQSFMITSNANVQLTTSPAVRGRVLALYMAVFMGGTPIGAPLLGWIVNQYGPRSAMLVAAVAALVSATLLGVFLLRQRGVGLRFWRAFTRRDAIEELELEEIAARKL